MMTIYTIRVSKATDGGPEEVGYVRGTGRDLTPRAIQGRGYRSRDAAMADLPDIRKHWPESGGYTLAVIGAD